MVFQRILGSQVVRAGDCRSCIPGLILDRDSQFFFSLKLKRLTLWRHLLKFHALSVIWVSLSDAILTHPKRLGRCVKRSPNLGGDGQFLLECPRPRTLNTKVEWIFFCWMKIVWVEVEWYFVLEKNSLSWSWMDVFLLNENSLSWSRMKICVEWKYMALKLNEYLFVELKMYSEQGQIKKLTSKAKRRV